MRRATGHPGRSREVGGELAAGRGDPDVRRRLGAYGSGVVA